MECGGYWGKAKLSNPGSVEQVSPLFVAIDGFDGSGKTTLTSSLREYFSSRGSSCAVIGRRAKDSDVVTGALTELVLDSDGTTGLVDDDANAHIRLARLHQRAALGQKAGVDFVFFDRWIASDISRLSPASLHRYVPAFLTAHRSIPIGLTVRLVVDFPTAWRRINARSSSELSPSEKRGEARNRELYDQLNLVWDRWWTEPVISVGSTQSAEEVLASVVGQIQALSRKPA